MSLPDLYEGLAVICRKAFNYLKQQQFQIPFSFIFIRPYQYNYFFTVIHNGNFFGKTRFAK